MNDGAPPTADDTSSGGASGRWAILAIGALTVFLLTFNLWYHRQMGRRALEFWGPAAGQLIVHAPQAQLWRIERAAEADAGDPAAIRWGNAVYRPVESRDLATINGAQGVRTSLIHDGTFRWEGAAECEPNWTHALRFERDTEQITVLVSLDCPRVALAGGERTASIEPIRQGMTTFVTQQFAK